MTSATLTHRVKLQECAARIQDWVVSRVMRNGTLRNVPLEVRE